MITLRFSGGCAQSVDYLAVKYGKSITEKQLLLQRVANVIIDLYGMTAVISRVSSAMPNRTEAQLVHEKNIAKLFCKVRTDFCNGSCYKRLM